MQQDEFQLIIAGRMAEGERKRPHDFNQSDQSEQNQYKRSRRQPPEQTRDQRQNYPSLSPDQRDKLEEFFNHIIANASVDYSTCNTEIQDIRSAVHEMLQRIRSRVNRRGIFDIVEVVPAGSMAENTSLWKFDRQMCFENQFEFDWRRNCENYLEFDFLARLSNSVHQCENLKAQGNCQGCIGIIKPPVELKRLRQCYNREEEFNAESLKNGEKINSLFLIQINYCLTSLSNAFPSIARISI